MRNNMIKEVTMYKAADGSVHNTDQSAQRQSEEFLLNTLEDFLKATFPDAHRPSLIKAVQTLADNPEMAKARLRSLLAILSYKDSNDD